MIETDTEWITLLGEVTTSVNSTPGNLEWDGNTAVFNVTSDRGTIVNGMRVNATPVYNTGWNEALDHCSEPNNVYRISENQPASPLYMKVGDNYTSVGNGWVRTVRATGVYTLPARKT